MIYPVSSLILRRLMVDSPLTDGKFVIENKMKPTRVITSIDDPTLTPL